LAGQPKEQSEGIVTQEDLFGDGIKTGRSVIPAGRDGETIR
jgi:hypothetical protein